MYIHGQDMGGADQFAFLGRVASADGDTKLDVTGRIKSAKSAFDVSFKIWKHKNHNTNIKLRFFGAVVCKYYMENDQKGFKSLLNTVSPLSSVYSGHGSVKMLIGRQKWQWLGQALKQGDNSITGYVMEWYLLSKSRLL